MISAPALAKRFDIVVGIFNHQVDIKREPVVFLTMILWLDNSNIGNKMSIHDINVDPIGAGFFHRGNFFAEPGAVAERMEGAIRFIIIPPQSIDKPQYTNVLLLSPTRVSFVYTPGKVS